VAPEGYTDEDIDRAHQEYLFNGGDPDISFIVIKFVSPSTPGENVV
jgi:hypothetical protein